MLSNWDIIFIGCVVLQVGSVSDCAASTSLSIARNFSPASDSVQETLAHAETSLATPRSHSMSAFHGGRIGGNDCCKRRSREMTNIAILQMYNLSTKIVVEGTVISEETSNDNFFSEFFETFALARMISANLLVISENHPIFHFHLNIVSPLFIVLLKCRNASSPERSH